MPHFKIRLKNLVGSWAEMYALKEMSVSSHTIPAYRSSNVSAMIQKARGHWCALGVDILAARCGWGWSDRGR